MLKILNYLKYTLLSKASRCIYLWKKNFHDIQLYFYYLANCRETGRDRERSDWLAACDRQTVHLITLKMDSDTKLFGLISHLPGGNHSFPTIKQKTGKKKRKHFVLFCFSCWGSLCFFDLWLIWWWNDLDSARWLLSLEASAVGGGRGGGGEGCHMTRCDPAEDGGAWQLLSHADVVQME